MNYAVLLLIESENTPKHKNLTLTKEPGKCESLYEPCQIYMYTLQLYHTSNIIDILLMVSDKLTKPRNLTWPWKWDQGHMKLARQDIYTLQSFNTQNIVALLLIKYEK